MNVIAEGLLAFAWSAAAGVGVQGTLAEAARKYAARDGGLTALSARERGVAATLGFLAAIVAWLANPADAPLGAAAGAAGAALGVLLVLDDCRHLGVSLEIVAAAVLCGCLWRYGLYGFDGVGRGILAACIAGGTAALLRMLLLLLGRAECYGDGEWALFALAGLCLGLNERAAGVALLIAFGLHLLLVASHLLRHRRAPGSFAWAPFIALGVIGGGVLG